ncbi:GTPase HflX [Effusibacillus lacus]|uniref:GTPase HflX n=1 Tax=Effusibacillus lacus TaxID=1348429 RepID=A0A292YRG3_9BACL|nr:GTPase HflX [Effusibacillus lacus]TCS75831.1 GTP-binding protein HflX [Effusibacillus lacus]GAX91776.1 GTPase HflX [Effusibacillus lacus]
MYETTAKRERAVLVGLQTGRQPDFLWKLAFEELKGLVETAGAEVISDVVQARKYPEPSTYIGKGKLQELAAVVKELEANLAVFDSELSPAQVRNLEQALDCKVLDRTQIILDIFAGRARTKEGKLQVELAQLVYSLPRLTGRGIAMSRLGGGIGTRGPGETKLEVDRRRIRQRIADLRAELREVRQHRQTQRQQRKKREIPVLALVGYTNAGKSTLLHTMIERFGTGSHVADSGRNRLFDTLDPTTRRIELPGGKSIIVTDTVGFIQRLPHQLVDAFRATLEETAEADLLLHVVDASHPEYEIQMETVYQVLEDLDASRKSIITVLNKMDLVKEEWLPDDPCSEHTFRLSSKSGKGIAELAAWVASRLNRSAVRMQVFLPYSEGPFLSKLHAKCKVYSQEFEENGIRLDLDVIPEYRERIAPFKVN